VFDHTIFALHSLSAMGLLLTANLLLDLLIGDVASLLFLAAPVHLYIHMRGVYASSALGTLLRMVLLFAGSLFGFALLMIGLTLVTLNVVGAA
jgi:hypothetical protein